jgi:putative MFS transporter
VSVSDSAVEITGDLARPEDVSEIAARIERLPFSSWHVRLVAIVGLAHMLDAFDSLTIALVLPVLIEIWHFKPNQIGLMISMGYVGQIVGAVLLSWLAERVGRLAILRLSLAIAAIFSVATAFAGSYVAFLVLRLVQGIGLGGEVPVAATLVNELTPARFRGRMTSSLQSMFGVGILLTSVVAAVLVPRFGWRCMFYLGALPGLLMCFIGGAVPESPRWLVLRSSAIKSRAVMSRIESAVGKQHTGPRAAAGLAVCQPINQNARFAELFSSAYLVRTVCVWILMFCISATGNALITWLPTIYRTAYHVNLANTFWLSSVLGAAGLAGAVTSILAIDSIGRRMTFIVAFFGSAAPLAIITWSNPVAIAAVVFLLTTSNYFIAIGLGSVHVYATEIYPTRMRALGAGTAMAWLRVAQVVSPLIIGWLLSHFGATSVFLLLAVMGVIGGITVAIAAIETKGRRLEEISA